MADDTRTFLCPSPMRTLIDQHRESIGDFQTQVAFESYAVSRLWAFVDGGIPIGREQIHDLLDRVVFNFKTLCLDPEFVQGIADGIPTLHAGPEWAWKRCGNNPEPITGEGR